ncbi:hypothetical protein L0F63_000099 [Massospora cicadina]|nr:hypothetical protein L0F63_000099 [Massospora cicadina]
MKEFVWMAIFGFLTTLITLIIVVVVALVELPMVDAVLSLAYAGNVVHPHLEGAMANPKRWPVALTLGLGTVCVFYLLMSIVGYYVYGESAEEIIFSNLRAVVPANFSRTLISVHVLMTGPILLCSFGLEFETMLSITPEAMGVKKSALLRVFSRGITVAILTIVAMFIPHFMAIMGIIGAFFNCLNLYHFPIFCHVRLFGLRGRSLVEYIVMLITLSIATICFFWGGYNAIIGMVEAIKSSSA